MDGSTLHFLDSYHLLSYDTIDSTNEEAKRLAAAGGQHGAVIWAEAQTAGKGREGRTWVSEAGNLFCSLLLQPCVLQTRLPQLSFVTSLALYRALEGVVHSTHNLALKWPNDILLDDKKLGGILLETLPDPESDARWVIIGVGVNVEHYPKDMRYPATSLKATGVEIISAKIVLSRFLNCFQPLYDEWLEQGFTKIRTEWVKVAAFIKQPITLQVHADAETIRGVFKGIDKNGHLLLQRDDGSEQPYAAGDVSVDMCDVTGH
jgi:BirA family transcriptional regulator, biotin operon repressor / biotin---[acetyl-CoA-carboxylase] ligase